MSLEDDGFAWSRRAVDPSPFAALYPTDAASARAAERKPLIRQLADRLCPAGSHLLRAIFFNKTAKGNWLVPWHQDIVIKDAVRAWTPTAAELSRILACRIHLDPADSANGCLRVIPGSHRQGILSDAQVESWRVKGPIVDCEADAGDVLWMRPLLLHASSKTGERESTARDSFGVRRCRSWLPCYRLTGCTPARNSFATSPLAPCSPRIRRSRRRTKP